MLARSLVCRLRRASAHGARAQGGVISWCDLHPWNGGVVRANLNECLSRRRAERWQKHFRHQSVAFQQPEARLLGSIFKFVQSGLT